MRELTRAAGFLTRFASLGAALAIVACTGDAPTGSKTEAPAFAPVGAAVRTPKARPISGRCELTIIPLPSTPPIVRQIDTGTCQISHLGRAAFSGVQDINVAAGTQSGERTFTAANGDILRAVHSGTSGPVGPGLVGFAAIATFVGGTGRFANATGQVHIQGVANLLTRTTVMSFEGWIAYDASDRNGR